MSDEQKEEEKKSGIVGQIVIVAVLTLVAAGTGWALGSFVLKPGAQQEVAKVEMEQAEKEKKKEKKQKKKGDDGDGGEEEGEETAMSGHIVELQPITANIATPEDTWLRLELAVLFSDKPDLETPEKIHQDIVAFVQTLKLYQMEGASGIRHLRQDMNELAKIRSEGKAKAVLIRAMLLE